MSLPTFLSDLTAEGGGVMEEGRIWDWQVP